MSSRDQNQASPTASFTSHSKETSITGEDLEEDEVATRSSLSLIDFTRESITNSMEHSYDEQYADRILKKFEERQFESISRPDIMSLFSQHQSDEDEFPEAESENLSEQEEENRKALEREEDGAQQNPTREFKEVGLSNRFANLERELLNDFFIYTPDQSQTGVQLSQTQSNTSKDANQMTEAEHSDNSISVGKCKHVFLVKIIQEEKDPYTFYNITIDCLNESASSLDELVRTYEKRTRQQTEAIRQLQFEIANIKSFPSTPDPTGIVQDKTDDTLSQISRSTADDLRIETSGIAVTDNDCSEEFIDDDESDPDFFFSSKGQITEHNKSDDMTISSSFIVNANDHVNRETLSDDLQRNRSQHVASLSFQKATNEQTRSISILQDMLREEMRMREMETENKKFEGVEESVGEGIEWTLNVISSPPSSSPIPQLHSSNQLAKWSSASPPDNDKNTNDTRDLLTDIDDNARSGDHFTITTHELGIPPSQEGAKMERFNRIRQLRLNPCVGTSAAPRLMSEQHFHLHFPVWVEFNEMLRVNGFVGITDEDATDLEMFITVLVDRLRDVLNSYDNRGKMLESVAREKRQVQEIVDKYHSKTTELNQELQRYKAAALRRSELESRAQDRHNISVSETISDLNRLVKRLKKEKDELKERLIQNEAELRFKTDELSQLQRKLDNNNAEEERRDKLARGIFHQHYKRTAANNRSDNREISLISMYEEMRNKHLEQIRHLTNELQRKSEHNDGSNLISDLRKEIHRIQEKYNKLQTEYATNIRVRPKLFHHSQNIRHISQLTQNLKNSELKYAQTVRFAKGLQKENEKLLEEIQARPSNEQILSEFEAKRHIQSKQRLVFHSVHTFLPFS